MTILKFKTLNFEVTKSLKREDDKVLSRSKIVARAVLSGHEDFTVNGTRILNESSQDRALETGYEAINEMFPLIYIFSGELRDIAASTVPEEELEHSKVKSAIGIVTCWPPQVFAIQIVIPEHEYKLLEELVLFGSAPQLVNLYFVAGAISYDYREDLPKDFGRVRLDSPVRGWNWQLPTDSRRGYLPISDVEFVSSKIST
jgi:hypothetical protein